MTAIRLALLSLAVSAGGWLLVFHWLDGVAISTRLGYGFYCFVIAIPVALFFMVALRIRSGVRGSFYALIGITWALLGWLPTYLLALVFTSGLVVVVSSSPYLWFIPVGLPVTDICAASAAIGSLAVVTALLVDAVLFLRSRVQGSKARL